MNVVFIINVSLFAFISLTALLVAVSWGRYSRGRWRRHLTGWALMGLLAIIALITGNAVLSVVFGYNLYSWIYTVLYFVLWATLLAVGSALRQVYRDALNKKKGAV